MPKIQAIKNKKKKYENPIPTPMAGFRDMPAIMKRYRQSPKEQRKPSKPVAVSPVNPTIFDQPASQSLVVYWLGHTSLILEMGGRRYLLDPVLSQRASMFQNIGPKRMHPAPVDIRSLRNIDAVILSHDHYDHMDYHVMKHLAKSGTIFFVPLEVGKHLRKWGIESSRITEMTWWQEIKDGQNTIAATPARHFSGRGLLDRNTTLWCSWCIFNANDRVYFGGDSGEMPQYQDIGDTYGPFDLTIMPIGAYDEAWGNIHINPAEAAYAHVRLRGNKLLPVHWATFNLAIHPWAEPIEMMVEEAAKNNITLITPVIGEKVVPGEYISREWWV